MQFDDFVVVKHASAFALTGPGLNPKGVPFVTVEDAIERGRVIARNSRVSLWDATTKDAAVLVAVYRH